MGRARLIAVGALLAGLVVLAPAAPGGADANEEPTASAPFRALAVGLYHSCVILGDGSVKCWGEGTALGLGDTEERGDEPGEMGDALPTVDLGTGRTAVELAAGGGFTCALLDTAQVKCWGYNGGGQLGSGTPFNAGWGPDTMGDDLAPVNLGTGRSAVHISAGANHTCAILDNGLVKCWGYNTAGQLGLGNTSIRGHSPSDMGDNLPYVPLGTDRTATAISAGGDMTCVLLDDDTVKCWGTNGAGQAGQGDTDNRGDNGGEMGDALLPIALGTGRTAKAVAATGGGACAILDNDTLKCWGGNNVGQLGQGNTANLGDGLGEMGDALPTVPLGTGRTVQAISGSGHVCALLDDDTVKCWGQNEYGQVGRGSTGHVGDGGGEMGDALPVVNLGTGRTVTAVSTGGFHTCALLDNGQYKCWGYNGDGGLGLGDTGGRGGGAGQMGDALPAVRLTGPSEALTCDGQPVTVDLNEEQTPTAGADVILGTPGPDTINALGGLDRICGGGGVDTVNAGPGNDRVFGQAGNDALTGGTGNDRLDGGTQNDTLNGGDGTDTLLGGLGGDTVNGGNQADTVFGGDGNDRLNGQNHNDTLNGQVGADTLDGGANNDRLNGGGQRDTCHGRAGTDSQSGCEVRTGIP